MAAKVQWYRDAWWVMTHADGRRWRKRVGPTKSNKRDAEEIAQKVNAALTLGTFQRAETNPTALPCDLELRRWLDHYSVTLKPGTITLVEGLIENHLAPFFGAKDLREIGEEDILRYIRQKLDQGQGPKTIRNALSLLRRVCSLLVRAGRLERNPASGMGELIRRVAQATARETEEVEHWSRPEVATLLAVARETEPGFALFLMLLFSTGMRRGEALGLQWADVDFDARTLSIRRSITSQGVGTPKSGKARRVPMTTALADDLFDLFAARRRQALARGWAEVPVWVFCSEAATAPDPRNVERVWQRVRRRAQVRGVRPLKLHCARHTWATFALEAGKSVRWVADVLGHADPTLTLRVYAHAMRDAESDLSFADFASSDATGRPQTAPREDDVLDEARNIAESLARREGLEPPTLRFEA